MIIAEANQLTGHRGTVLVASESDSFQDILGHMLGSCGFTPSYRAEGETAETSLSRTQPRFVVCDGDLPARAASLMLTEATRRGIPLLFSVPYRSFDRDVLISAGTRSFTFPLGKVAFSAVVDELLHRSTPSGPDETARSPSQSAARRGVEGGTR